jgi:ParB family chromosome partitioning protein
MMMRSQLQPRPATPQAIREAVTTELPSPIDLLPLAHGRPRPGSVIQKISLDRLGFSPAGRRKINRQSIEALAARIHLSGQLHRLMVVLREDAQYYVVAGERRFAALQLLAEKGLIPPSFPVPCRVIQANLAVDLSAAEPLAQPDERRQRFLDLRERCPGLVTGSELAARQCCT